MSSKPKKESEVNTLKKIVNRLKGKCQKEKDTYASQFDQRLQPMIDEVEKLKTELEYVKKQHTIKDKRIEDLTKENKELWQNNKMLSSVVDDRTSISDKLNSIKDDHEAVIKFRAETEKTLAELNRKHEEDVEVLQALLETEKEKVARQQFHNSQVVDLLVKRHKEEKNQMQQFYDENTSKLADKAYAAETTLKIVIGIYDKYIAKLEEKMEIGKSVTINAVKEREEEHKSLQCTIEGLLTHNTKLQVQNELMGKTVKDLTDEKDQMGKTNEKTAQQMKQEMKQKCQSNIRALAFEKKKNAKFEEVVVSLKKINEDLKKALSKEKEEHRKTAVDRHKVKAAHNQALAEKISLQEQLRSTKEQTEIFTQKTNCLEKKKRHFQEELYQCVLSFEKAFPHAGHFGEKEKVEFRDIFLNLKEKYVDGVEGIPFVGTTNFLRTRCKDLEAALLNKKRELESFKRKYNDMVKSSEYALFKQKQELIGPVNQMIRKADNEEKEIGHLKSRVKDVQLELKLEKQKGQKLASLLHRSVMGRCYGETPTPSQIFPQIKPRPPPVQTKFIQVPPKHPGRRVGRPSPVYLPVESPSTPPFLNADDGLPPINC